MSTHANGRAAEDAAARELTRLGYRIVARNFRAAGAEIDIVAVDAGTIVFVEVKARANRAFASALAAVDGRKRAKLRIAAEEFLQFHAPSAKTRFDVVCFEHGRMRLHRNAF